MKLITKLILLGAAVVLLLFLGSTLGFLGFVFSIPVITMGASITAMFYVGMKLVRDEEGYVFKGFIKSFKQNFKQGFLIELIIGVVAALLIADIRICYMWAKADGGPAHHASSCHVHRISSAAADASIRRGRRLAFSSAIFLYRYWPSAASCDITADDALNRKHLKLTAHHALSFEFLLLEEFRHVFYIYGNHVIRDNVFRQVKPELGHLCQYLAFVCHFVM